MVALAGGDDIKCSDYATFGTTNLSKNIINAGINATSQLKGLLDKFYLKF